MMSKSSGFKTAFTENPTVAFATVGDSETLQEFKDEADIVKLCRRYKETGSFYDLIASKKGITRYPVFGDFVGIGDATAQQQAILDGNQAFMKFPARLREQFNNDIGAFLAYLHGDHDSLPDVKTELEKLGFFNKTPQASIAPDVSEAPAPVPPQSE